MTALGSGMPDRETTTGEAPRRGIGPQIAAIMLIGLVFRLMMAYAYEPLRGSGFGNDLGLFYTPGYLYALWPVGVVGNLLGGVGDLIKLPAILTDIALGFVVYLMARDLGVTERRATIAAAVVIFNPITWFERNLISTVPERYAGAAPDLRYNLELALARKAKRDRADTA